MHKLSENRLFIIGLTTVLCAAVLIIDLNIPLGVAGGVPYLVPVFVASQLPGTKAAIWTAVVCTGLVILGLLYSPGGGEMWQVLLNRGLALFVIWVVIWFIIVRKWVEEALTESEKQYRGLLENAPDGMVIVDAKAKIEIVNQQLLDITGYTSDELIGQPVEVLIPEWFNTHKQQRDIYIANPRTRAMGEDGMELFVRCKGGSEFLAEISLSPLETTDGLNISAAIRDITERKQAETLLTNSHRALSMLNQCNYALIHISEERKLLDEICNIIAKSSDYCLAGVAYVEHDEQKTMRVMASAGRGRGYLKSIKVTWGQDELGCGPWGIAIKTEHHYIANDLMNNPRFLPWWEAAKKYDHASEVVLPLKKHDEDVFGILVIYSSEVDAFDSDEVKLLADLANNLSYGIISLRIKIQRKQAEDELLKSEERLRHALDATSDGVWDWNIKTGEVTFSNKWCQSLGYEPDEFVNNVNFWEDILHPDDIEETLEKVNNHFEGKTDTYTHENRLKKKSGGYRYNLGRGRVFEWDEDGTPLRMIGTDTDINDRKQAENKIKQTNKRLRNLTIELETAREEERTQIARDLHDELGQSLTGLKMDLTFLVKKLPKNLEELPALTQSMFSLVENMLNFVRKLSTELRPPMLDDLGIKEAIEWQLHETAERAGFAFNIDLPKQALVTDTQRDTSIYRIFQEILTNVARHAEATFVDVSLHKSDSQLILTVKDNGVGITKQNILGDNSLGLMGMRERTNVLGGNIQIEAAKEGGTKITLTLPLSHSS